MSAYAHQMERELSARSLSSRGGSEMGSHYVVESGFYMTSFAAAIFVAGLGIVGVLLITMLIALTVMLQSCQSSSKGVIEIQKLNDNYYYCKNFALHAELNSLGPDDLPSICRSLAIQHIEEGQYERDLNISLWLVERYFDRAAPSDDGLDVLLMDIDYVLPSNPHYIFPMTHRPYQDGCRGCFKKADHTRQIHFLRLYMKLQAGGWSLILLSRKPEKQQNATVEYLISAGYSGWSSLIMRLDNEMEIDSSEFFLRRRVVMQKQGFRISGVISSQMDALTGPYLGKRVFKLPNPRYYFGHHGDKTHMPE